MLTGQAAPGGGSGPGPGPLLRARSISKAFPGVQALRGVDFSCLPGSVHALVGENGAGKSTLVSILTGSQLPDGGEMTWLGQRFEPRTPKDSLSAGIAAVYQELTVLPQLTVTDNVLLGQEMTQRLGVLDRRAERARVTAMLAELGLPAVRPGAEAGTLSVAQQQLVEIARALIRDARLLILDEPSAVLAGQELANLFRVIRDLTARGVAVLYISHRLNEVSEIADQVTVLRDGAVVSTGPASEYPTARIIKDMVGREVTLAARDRQPPGQVVLGVRNLLLPGTEPDGISLDVRAGEIVGLGGLIGSGRSRVLRTLAGLEGPCGGEVSVAGQPLRHLTLREAIRHKIALVPEERKTQGLVLDMSVAANITMPRLAQLSRLGVLSRRDEEAAATGSVRRLGIKASSPWQATRELSGGTQQKVVLARWMQTEPAVLLLDEPTRGIDIGAKSEIYDLIYELSGTGAAILLVSSELPELIGLCDRILVMRAGRVAGELSRAQASEEGVLSLALGHEAEVVSP